MIYNSLVTPTVRAKTADKSLVESEAPTIVNSSVRTREYLTAAEVERLQAAARKFSRWAHRDATMILLGYRHGLRASELCDLQWSQVELATGRLHVRRAACIRCGARKCARCAVCSASVGHHRMCSSPSAAVR